MTSTKQTSYVLMVKKRTFVSKH